MENANYIAISSLTALQRQMDVHANNIANSNTTAYKAQRVLFMEYLGRSADGQKLSFVIDQGVNRDMDEGPITPTENPLDVAIRGDGYFTVETKDGVQYTRNGNFRLGPEGELATSNGRFVLDEDGEPIVIPEGDKKIDIGKDGTVATESGLLAKLGIVSFRNEQSLRPVGDGLYSTTEEPRKIQNGTVLQGRIEASNVQPILEMTQMIELVRRYQSTVQFLKTQEDLQRRAIDQLVGNG